MWAGVLPIAVTFGEPQADPGLRLPLGDDASCSSRHLRRKILINSYGSVNRLRPDGRITVTTPGKSSRAKTSAFS
jgi:hypothetical protein